MSENAQRAKSGVERRYVRHAMEALEADLYGEAWLALAEGMRAAERANDAALDRAVDALLADSGLPRFGPHRATIERRQRIAFEAVGLTG